MAHVSNAGLEGGFDHRVRQWKPPGQQQFHVPTGGVPWLGHHLRDHGIPRHTTQTEGTTSYI